MAKKILFTSESVSEGHPDKLCDQIADAILDACLEGDKNSRVAVEVLATVEKVVIAGEVTTKSKVDYEKIARQVMEDVGYISPEMGIGASSAEIEVLVKNQSNDIAQGVDSSFDSNSLGAGDQGMMFGYASSETENLMPLPIVMAHKIVRTGALLRKNGTLKHARPDMKAQVTIDYTDEKNPRVDTIVCSCQHDEEVDIEDFRKELLEVVIKPVVSSFNMNLDFKYYINPTGRFVIGGPQGDTGLTGRKIIIDTYGGYSRHGGGAFSGKDPTKVDRSAAYAARYVAKNIVAAGLADKCEIELAYAIGVARPLSIFVDTFGTGKVSEEELVQLINKNFDLRPGAIIRDLDLRRPIYKQTAAYGHFGRTDIDLPWERTDKAEILREQSSIK